MKKLIADFIKKHRGFFEVLSSIDDDSEELGLHLEHEQRRLNIKNTPVEIIVADKLLGHLFDLTYSYYLVVEMLTGKTVDEIRKEFDNEDQNSKNNSMIVNEEKTINAELIMGLPKPEVNCQCKCNDGVWEPVCNENEVK